MTEKQTGTEGRQKTKTRPERKRKPASRRDVKRNEALEQAKQEIACLRDQLLRITAEMENIRKRKDREMEQFMRTANRELLLALLAAVDDFDRSLKTADPDTKGHAEFRTGIELIYQKLTAVLHRFGVEPMESVGQPFDVDRHDALLQVEKPGTPPGVVVEEHEKGYFLNGQILRHARVIVSK